MPPPMTDPAAAVSSFLARGGQVVTFDVFDTLLWRRVLFPADAFGLMRGGRHARAWRILAEMGATAWCRRVLRREPRLADIYRLFPFDPEDEMALEVSLCRPNTRCLNLVRRLVADGVRLAALSDMYLSGAQIARLLRHAGFPDVPVYASSDVNRSKSAGGALFAHVGAQLGVPPASWLHVGDNPHADIAMAEQHGLQACQVRAPRDLLLGLLPALATKPRTAFESSFLGEVAMALYERFGADDLPPQALAAPLEHAMASARRDDPRGAWGAVDQAFAEVGA